MDAYLLCLAHFIINFLFKSYSQDDFLHIFNKSKIETKKILKVLT